MTARDRTAARMRDVLRAKRKAARERRGPPPAVARRLGAVPRWQVVR